MYGFGQRVAPHRNANLRSTDPSADSFAFFVLDPLAASSEKHFQKRKVSSAAADTTVFPSGLCAMCNTRAVCPVNSAIFCMVGYFHKHSWFCE